MSLPSVLRIAARSLSKNPVFSLTAVAVLALGIGANSAVFGLVNQMLFSPEGLSDPSRVVAIRARYGKLNLPSIGLSGPDFRDARDARDVFQHTAAAQSGDVVYEEGGEPKVLRGAAVSREWFDVFGARPLLGRTFVAEEDEEGGQRALVLAHSAWVSVFGADPSVVGRLVTVDGKPTKVVGVMPDGFRWPREVDAWLPLALPRAEFTDDYRFNEHLLSVARLRPGVTVGSADAGVRLLAARVTGSEGRAAAFARSSQWGMFVQPLTAYVAGDSRTPMLVLLGAVGFVLLIACANIAGLMVARTTSRQREIAVRAALGAGRWQLAAQTLAESALLSGAGAAVGLGLAWAGMRLMIVSAPEGSAVGLRPALDPAVLLFTAVATVVSALLFALAPAWHVGRLAPVEHLKSATRAATGGQARQRMRSTLVVAETALAMVLLVGAGLLIRSLGRLQDVAPGFDPRGVVVGMVALPDRHYAKPEQRAAFYRSVLDRIREDPRVVAVGAGGPIPFGGNDSTASFDIEGRPSAPGEPGPHGRSRAVSAGYFAAIGIPLKAGRSFTDDDRLGTEPVVVIDENLARAYWPNDNPIGKRIGFGGGAAWMTIVGIVGNVVHTNLAGESDKGTYYRCLLQRPQSAGWLVARLRKGTSVTPAPIAAAVRAIDPGTPVQRAGTMMERVSASLSTRRFVVQLLIFFAAVALGMAALGLYGVVSYSVAQRTQEIGVRMALGAGRGAVVGLVLKQGTALAGAGIALGSLASAGLNRLLASQLFNVSPFDPVTFAGMVAVLLLAAFAASFVPAWAASRIDPLRALRYE
jgi:predicted permease